MEGSVAFESGQQSPPQQPAWQGFSPGNWQHGIDVHDFIIANVTPYCGDASFLSGPTARTCRLWKRVKQLLYEERQRGVLDISQIPSSILAHAPGYIDRDLELIVGLQTDAPLKRAVFPNGGLRMVRSSLAACGCALDPQLEIIFTRYRKTHNDGVFDVYPEHVLRARRSHLIAGLPDAYGRGRIIGDYRRVALYGTAALLQVKQQERTSLDAFPSSEDVIRDREELAEQMRALQELTAMARAYGHDVSQPAATAREAVQWLYFAYLAAVKEQDGAAMSLGRTSTFLDCYIERDLGLGSLTEQAAQELVDDFVIKLRCVRFLRTPDCDQVFSGEPIWVTEAIGGMSEEGTPLVTKASFRFLHTLYNLGPASEPNLTVLWSADLPQEFKNYCARVSLETSSIQYESDALLRSHYDDDTAIACCVSAVRVGRQMHFFGARVNLVKCLLYALNGGRDELSGEQVMTSFEPVRSDVLALDQVLLRFDLAMDWLAATYVDAMNCIHYMHDKYAYERLEMALHDYAPDRTMAFGIAGLSVVADSLSAIEYARVQVVRDERGLIVDFRVAGEFPKFGNDDDRVDRHGRAVASAFIAKLRRHPTYRNAEHTQSILTLTSNIVYGRHTGNTPDGRRRGQPFALDANPLQGRAELGLLAAALSVAKLPYEACQDGISMTASPLPEALGDSASERAEHLTRTLDAVFDAGLFHLDARGLARPCSGLAASAALGSKSEAQTPGG